MLRISVERLVTTLLTVVLFALTFSSCTKSSSKNTDAVADEERSSDEWKPLFDGTSTAGWRGRDQDSFPAQGWNIADGVLTLNGASDSARIGDVLTEAEYSNFILEWEWKMLTKGGNSGIKYLVKENSDEFGPGFEYQMLDDEHHPMILDGTMQPGDYHTTAALYELYPAPRKSLNPVGEWNHSRVVVRDSRIEHWLNGEMVLACDRTSDDFNRRVLESKFNKYPRYGQATEGHILLQDHGSQMAFRNIRIKEL